ncbi:unnamed protein product [Amaranthus hypochondriacus]
MHTNGEAKQEEKKGQKWVNSLEIGLRLSAFVTSISATCIAFTSNQSALIFGIQMEAKYSYSSAFKFYAFATAIASVSCVLSLGFIFFLNCRTAPSKGNYNWFIFMHDLVIMCVLVSGCAAATSIGYVGQYGNEHAGWMPICDHFHAFCHKITTAVALGYISFIFFFFLTIVSATTVAPTLHL